MSRGGKIGIAAAAVVVLGIAAVPLAERALTRRYERRIVQAVEGRYGGKLTIDDFHVGLLTSRASCSGFRYEDPPDSSYRVVFSCGPTSVEVEGLSFDPDPVILKEVRLERPEIVISRTARGDWDRGVPGVARDLLEVGLTRAKKALGIKDRPPREPRATAEAEPGKRREVVFRKVVISGAKVRYEDDRFSDTPIRLTLRSFGFEGTEISGSDLWQAFLTSEADGTLEIGHQSIDIKAQTRTVQGAEKRLWSLEALGIDLGLLASPVLRSMSLKAAGGTLDVRISHAFDISLSQRSTIVVDWDLRAHGVALELLPSEGPAMLRVPGERLKSWVDSRGGELALTFSVEAAPDLALLGKDAGSVVEAIGRMTFDAFKKQLLDASGISWLTED